MADKRIIIHNQTTYTDADWVSCPICRVSFEDLHRAGGHLIGHGLMAAIKLNPRTLDTVTTWQAIR